MLVSLMCFFKAVLRLYIERARVGCVRSLIFCYILIYILYIICDNKLYFVGHIKNTLVNSSFLTNFPNHTPLTI